MKNAEDYVEETSPQIYDEEDKHPYQSLYAGSKLECDRYWMLNDTWSKELAIKLIVFNYPVDPDGKGWEGLRNWHIDKWGHKAFLCLSGFYKRALDIANSTIQAGTIKEHDTPANWIKWAKDKGYSVAHLMTANAPIAKGEDETDTTPPPHTITENK